MGRVGTYVLKGLVQGMTSGCGGKVLVPVHVPLACGL